MLRIAFVATTTAEPL